MAAALSRQLGGDPVQRWNLLLATGAAAVGWGVESLLFAGSLALGALLEAVNFRQLRRHCEQIVFGGGPGSALATASFGLRFALLAVAIGVALYSGAHPVGLVLGLSTIIPAAVGVAFWTRPAPSGAEPLPALPAEDPSWDAWSVWRAGERDPDPDDPDEPDAGDGAREA